MVFFTLFTQFPNNKHYLVLNVLLKIIKIKKKYLKVSFLRRVFLGAYGNKDQCLASNTFYNRYNYVSAE